MTKPKIAVVGASGYSGEELVRILLGHPEIALVAVTSRQSAGKTVAEVFPKFAGYPRARELVFQEPDAGVLAGMADLVFLALPHGVAAEFAVPLVRAGVRVIDLSADFRLRSAAVYEEFYGGAHPAPELLGEAVYGLPEWRREAVRSARLIAAPGCYPTSILVPLLPLLRDGVVRAEGIIADSMSGVSGAGRKAEAAYLFCECAGSLRAYGVPKHRHLSEIEQELSAAAGEAVVIGFTPHLVPVIRGIHTTIYACPVDPGRGAEAVLESWRAAYAGEPFVRVLEGAALPDTKHVAGTNGIEIAVRFDARTGGLVLFSAEDNLVKGAGGQAVQCMNLVCGFPETAGLL